MNPSESLRRSSFSLSNLYKVVSRPALIHTYLYGRKVKMFQDANGPLIYTPGYFEHSSFSGIEHPSIPLSIEIVDLRLPSSYADLTAKIKQEALGYKERNKTSKTWHQVVLLQVSMLWDLPTGEKGFTVLDEGNCGR